MREVADEEILAQIEKPNFSSSIATFYMGVVEDTEKSKEEGRPIFRDAPFVRIRVPGQIDVYDQPLLGDPRHPNSYPTRFPREWAAFKAGQETPLVGTPLSSWPVLSKARVEDFKFRGIKTVEQLAELADINSAGLMDFHSLKQKAKDYIDAAKGQAPLLAIRAENEAMKNEIEVMKRNLEQVIAASNKAIEREQGGFVSEQAQPINLSEIAAPKKRGRPFKTSNAES